MARVDAIIRQAAVLILVLGCIAYLLFSIANLPPAARRETATLSCFAAAPAPGSEAPVSAPPYPLPGRASTAARVQPLKEMAP